MKYPYPAWCSTRILAALRDAIGSEKLARTVLGPVALEYIAKWGHGATVGDRLRTDVMAEDKGSELFNYIPEVIIPSLTLRIQDLACLAVISPGEEWDLQTMERIEGMIRDESIRLANKIELKAWNEKADAERAQLKPTPYC